MYSKIIEECKKLTTITPYYVLMNKTGVSGRILRNSFEYRRTTITVLPIGHELLDCFYNLKFYNGKSSVKIIFSQIRKLIYDYYNNCYISIQYPLYQNYKSIVKKVNTSPFCIPIKITHMNPSFVIMGYYNTVKISIYDTDALVTDILFDLTKVRQQIIILDNCISNLEDI